jgi:hypothetical protein
MMTTMTINEKRKLLQQYWDAHAQFGPFDVTSEEFIRMHEDDNETLVAITNVDDNH